LGWGYQTQNRPKNPTEEIENIRFVGNPCFISNVSYKSDVLNSVFIIFSSPHLRGWVGVGSSNPKPSEKPHRGNRKHKIYRKLIVSFPTFPTNLMSKIQFLSFFQAPHLRGGVGVGSSNPKPPKNPTEEL
jgi:hypothetical protein